MPKITFIGAGSFGFTRKLVKDVLTFPRIEGATICLMDIDPMKLNYIGQAVQRIVREGDYPASVETTLSREEALDGADYVIVTILVGHTDVWRGDIEIPKSYGDRHKHRRHSRAVRYLPRHAHHSGDGGHCQGYGAALPRCGYAQLHQSDGDELPGDSEGDRHRRHRPLPQRPGYCQYAGSLDRRASRRNHLHLRRHQPTWPGI